MTFVGPFRINETVEIETISIIVELTSSLPVRPQAPQPVGKRSTPELFPAFEIIFIGKCRQLNSATHVVRHMIVLNFIWSHIYLFLLFKTAIQHLIFFYVQDY